MPAIRVSVIIVNWNGKAFLDECLTSLQSQSFRCFEVILVDNGSTDGSCEHVNTLYPWVQIVRLQVNSGFATGNNTGYERSQGEFIVTLNNDTKVTSDWLAELVKIADSDQNAGMVASCICQYRNPELIDSIGVRICADGMSRGAYRLQKLVETDCKDGDEVLVPSACAALYKRKMIEEIGFFDDDFFAYCEDTDLGLRGRLAGWKALLAKNAIVLHKYSMTCGEFSPFKLYLVERNHYWLALKCLPPKHLLRLPWASISRYILQARLVLAGKGSGNDFGKSSTKGKCLLAFIKGLGAVVTGLPNALKKRKVINNRKKVAWEDYSLLLERFQMSFEELMDVSHNQNMPEP